MFESSLIEGRMQRRPKYLFLVAVLLHGAGVAGAVFASVWNVDALPDPPTVVTGMYEETPPVPVKLGTPKPPEPEPEAAPRPKVDEPPPVVTQPKQLTDDVPVADDAPPSDSVASNDAATTGDGDSGSPDGVPFGDPQGTSNLPGAGDSNEPMEITAEMTPPVVLTRISPVYTEAGRRTKTQGVVILRATIDRTGRVTNVSVLKGLPMGLDEAAITAVEQWKFAPATLNGKPVPVFFQLTVTFRVH